jgi:2-oxoglutarate ferredoxin oxidoreductase subunit alpha
VQNAEFNLIGWGSTFGAIREAADFLGGEGFAINQIHLSEVWPFPQKLISQVLDNGAKNIVIENNATAQLAGLIKLEIGREVNGKIVKFDGRPFSPVEIVNRLKKEVF